MNATAVWSDQVIPEYSIPLCLYCWHPSGGGPGMREGEGALGALYRRGGERGASFCYMWVIAFIEPQRWQQSFLWHKRGNFFGVSQTQGWEGGRIILRRRKFRGKRTFCPLAQKEKRMKNFISILFHLNGWSQNQALLEVSEIGRICQQCNLASKLNAVFLSGISILENYCRLFDISCSQ